MTALPISPHLVRRPASLSRLPAIAAPTPHASVVRRRGGTR